MWIEVYRVRNMVMGDENQMTMAAFVDKERESEVVQNPLAAIYVVIEEGGGDAGVGEETAAEERGKETAKSADVMVGGVELAALRVEAPIRNRLIGLALLDLHPTLHALDDLAISVGPRVVGLIVTRASFVVGVHTRHARAPVALGLAQRAVALAVGNALDSFHEVEATQHEPDGVVLLLVLDAVGALEELLLEHPVLLGRVAVLDEHAALVAHVPAGAARVLLVGVVVLGADG